jgi:cytochrome c556
VKLKSFSVAAATVVVAASAVAYAHTGATGIYKERMDAMSAMGDAVKQIADMMRGQTDYNAERVREGARVIRSHAGEAMTELFPEGTTEMPSEARAEIWTDWSTFSALAEQLAVQAEGLERAAENGLAMSGGAASPMMDGQSSMMGTGQTGMMGTAMMGGQPGMMDAEQLASMPVDGVFAMVAQTCSSCHTKFRLEKK